MNGIKLLLIIVLFFSFSLGQIKDKDDVVTTPGEKGLLATTTGWYVNFRTSVRYVYDEIMYFKDLNKKYKKLKKWFGETDEAWLDVRDKTVNFFDDLEISVSKLEELEGIFDASDHLIYDQSKEWDRRMSDFEGALDNFAGEKTEWIHPGARSCPNCNPSTKTYCSVHKKQWKRVPGIIVPNTDKILQYMDSTAVHIFKMKLETPKKPKTVEKSKGDKLTPEEIAKLTDNGINDSIDYEQISNSSKLISASAIGNSNMYVKWANTTKENFYKTDKTLEKLSKGVNESRMISAYYSVENLNNTNKVIDHSIQELNLLCQLLGVEIFKQSKIRECQMSSAGSFARARFEILDYK